MLLSSLLKTKEGNMDYTHQLIYIYFTKLRTHITSAA